MLSDKSLLTKGFYPATSLHRPKMPWCTFTSPWATEFLSSFEIIVDLSVASLTNADIYNHICQKYLASLLWEFIWATDSQSKSWLFADRQAIKASAPSHVQFYSIPKIKGFFQQAQKLVFEGCSAAFYLLMTDPAELTKGFSHLDIMFYPYSDFNMLYCSFLFLSFRWCLALVMVCTTWQLCLGTFFICANKREPDLQHQSQIFFKITRRTSWLLFVNCVSGHMTHYQYGFHFNTPTYRNPIWYLGFSQNMQ